MEIEKYRVVYKSYDELTYISRTIWGGEIREFVDASNFENNYFFVEKPKSALYDKYGNIEYFISESEKEYQITYAKLDSAIDDSSFVEGDTVATIKCDDNIVRTVYIKQNEDGTYTYGMETN